MKKKLFFEIGDTEREMNANVYPIGIVSQDEIEGKLYISWPEGYRSVSFNSDGTMHSEHNMLDYVTNFGSDIDEKELLAIKLKL